MLKIINPHHLCLQKTSYPFHIHFDELFFIDKIVNDILPGGVVIPLLVFNYFFIFVG